MPQVPILSRKKSSFINFLQSLPKKQQKEYEKVLQSSTFKDEATILRAVDCDDSSYSGKAGQVLTVNSGETGVTFAAGAGDAAYNSGRLTAVSGTPDPTAETTTTSTIYYTPYRGNVISLLDASDAYEHLAFVETSLALTGLTANKNYTVYAYNNAGTLALSLSAAWTGDTTESEARETVKGLVVKASDHTKRIVGVIRATASNATCDTGGVGTTPGYRFVASLMNPLWRKYYYCPNYTDNSSGTSYSDGSSVAPTEIQVGGQVYRVGLICASSDNVNIRIRVQARMVPADNGDGWFGALVDHTSNSIDFIPPGCFTSSYGPASALGPLVLAASGADIGKVAGYHFVSPAAWHSWGVGSCTYYADGDSSSYGASFDWPLTFVHGELLC